MSNFSNQLTGSQFKNSRTNFQYGTNAKGNGVFVSDQDTVGYVTDEALDIIKAEGKAAFEKNLVAFAVIKTDDDREIPSLFKAPESTLTALW